jgi:iron complex transport system substrate-binding protein
MRIVSLLPSATEIVCALGLGECLVARSHECDYPPEIQDRPVITYSLIPPDLPSHEIDRLVSETLMTHATLYGLDVALLQQLDPDLLITQALCDVCAVSFNSVQEAVAQLSPRTRVLNLEPTTLQGVLDTFQQVADAAGVPERGRDLIAQFRERVERVRQRAQKRPPVRVTFLEWLTRPSRAGTGRPNWCNWQAASMGTDARGSPRDDWTGRKCWTGSPKRL